MATSEWHFVGFVEVLRRWWRCRLPWRSCWRCRGCGRWMRWITSTIGTMGPCRRAGKSQRLPGLCSSLRKRIPFPWREIPIVLLVRPFLCRYATSTKSYVLRRSSPPACFANLPLLSGCKIKSKARFLRSISLSLKPRIEIQSNLWFRSLAKILSTSFTRMFFLFMLSSSSVST